jgi:shikimate kinase
LSPDHNADIVGKARRETEILLNEDYREPLLLQLSKLLMDLLSNNGRQTLRRLIQEQEKRVDEERPPYCKHLLLASRKLIAAIIAPLRKPREKFEHALRRPAFFAPAGKVMALYGPEGYRHLERQSLERIVAIYDKVVLAVAGGIVSQPETFNYPLQNFHTIWLKAEPEEHMERVRGQGDERPMAGNPNAMAELRAILKNREALYSRAEAYVNTSKSTLEESLQAVLEAIDRQQILTT